MTVLIVMGAACASRKAPYKLEMTREVVLVPPTITSLAFEPGSAINTGDQSSSVKVTLTGDPRLHATFDVDGRFESHPMEEIAPGVYVGTFEVQKGDSGRISATAHLTHSSGAHQEITEHGGPVLVNVPTSGASERAVDGKVDGAGYCSPDVVREFDSSLKPLVVYFGSNSADLSDEAKETLTSNLGLLKSHPECTLYVHGHSDEIGTDDHNLWLSRKRSMVVGALLESLGVPHERIDEHCYGKTMPLNEGSTEEERALSRRVEIRAMNY